MLRCLSYYHGLQLGDSETLHLCLSCYGRISSPLSLHSCLSMGKSSLSISSTSYGRLTSPSVLSPQQLTPLIGTQQPPRGVSVAETLTFYMMSEAARHSEIKKKKHVEKCGGDKIKGDSYVRRLHLRLASRTHWYTAAKRCCLFIIRPGEAIGYSNGLFFD